MDKLFKDIEKAFPETDVVGVDCATFVGEVEDFFRHRRDLIKNLSTQEALLGFCFMTRHLIRIKYIPRNSGMCAFTALIMNRWYIPNFCYQTLSSLAELALYQHKKPGATILYPFNFRGAVGYKEECDESLTLQNDARRAAYQSYATLLETYQRNLVLIAGGSLT